MYSRYQNRPEQEVRLPKNYSGWAFAERKSEPRPTPSHRIDVALPSPPPESTPPPSPPPTDLPPPIPALLPPAHEQLSQPSVPQHEEHVHKEADTCPSTRGGDIKTEASCTSALPIGLPAGLGKKFPFSHGIGSDELILLGLIFLLSQNEYETDLPLWLTLLLFSG